MLIVLSVVEWLHFVLWKVCVLTRIIMNGIKRQQLKYWVHAGDEKRLLNVSQLNCAGELVNNVHFRQSFLFRGLWYPIVPKWAVRVDCLVHRNSNQEKLHLTFKLHFHEHCHKKNKLKKTTKKQLVQLVQCLLINFLEELTASLDLLLSDGHNTR